MPKVHRIFINHAPVDIPNQSVLIFFKCIRRNEEVLRNVLEDDLQCQSDVRTNAEIRRANGGGNQQSTECHLSAWQTSRETRLARYGSNETSFAQERTRRICEEVIIARKS